MHRYVDENLTTIRSLPWNPYRRNSTWISFFRPYLTVQGVG